MIRTPVDSSNIAAIGYDAANQILEVEFNRGGIYRYFRVGQGQFDALMAASSHGQYLNAEIKPNHAFDKVEEGDPARHIAEHQRQLDADGVEVAVSRQALELIGGELHFLRFAYTLNDTHDAPRLYEERFGWPAPEKFQ